MFRHLLKSTTVAVLAAGLGLGTAGTANAQHRGGGGHMAGGGGHMAGGGHAFAGGHASGGHAFYGGRPNVGHVGTTHFAAPRVGVGHAGGARNYAYHGGANYYRGGSYYRGGNYHGSYGRYAYSRPYGGYGYGYRYPYYGYRYPYGYGIGLSLALGYPYSSYGYNYPYYGYSYPYSYGSGYTYPDYGYYGSDYSGYGTDYVPPVASTTVTTEAAYPPAEVAPPAIPANAAVFTVQVPADAQVWIDGQPTTQTGPVRTYQTPDTLEPGRSYSYKFTAQWVVNGQPVVREQTVSFTAGSQIVVNLNMS